MGGVDLQLAKDLAVAVGVRRVVETGTYRGKTARLLAPVFDEVVTIEYDQRIYAEAVRRLADLPSVKPVQGHSVTRLAEFTDPATPTLFFLDGHWSGVGTAGEDDQCPVIKELAAIGSANPNDCVFIDDARFFTSTPPPPNRPEQWPTIVEVFDALRHHRPEHFVTVLNDQVVAVPQSGRAAIDAYAQRFQSSQMSVTDRAKGTVVELRQRLTPGS